jgi:hypothetical protein
VDCVLLKVWEGLKLLALAGAMSFLAGCGPSVSVPLGWCGSYLAVDGLMMTVQPDGKVFIQEDDQEEVRNFGRLREVSSGSETYLIHGDDIFSGVIVRFASGIGVHLEPNPGRKKALLPTYFVKKTSRTDSQIW